jgi:enterobactin synthetase component D
VSHKGPVVVALAAATAGAVGVDLERVEPRDDLIHEKVLTTAERELLPSDVEARRRSIVMHFSLKEAVYKALEPVEQADLEFEDIETVLADPVPSVWGSVEVQLLTRASRVRAAVLFDGDWLISAAMREPVYASTQ